MENTLLKQSTQTAVENCKKHTFYPWVKQEGLNPELVKSAKGLYLYMNDGKKYLDFSSQLVNMNIGHGNERVTQAINKQLQQFAFVSPTYATEVRAEVGEKLARIAPGHLNKVFFTLGGAEANENAIKIARLFTGKQKILTQYRSYHGASHGAMSAGGDPRKHPVAQYLMPGVVHFEGPYSYRCPWGTSTPEAGRDKALEHLERLIGFEGPQTIAAILLEGELGTSGCLKNLKWLLERCTRIG